MNVNPFLWVSVTIIFLIAEVGHPGLFLFLPFACGAAVSALVSVWTEPLAIQALSFVVACISAFVIIHVWLKKRLVSHVSAHKTNMDALVGQSARVTQTIEERGTGYVKINGQVWLARSFDQKRIEQDHNVEIVAVRGAHLIVNEVTSSTREG